MGLFSRLRLLIRSQATAALDRAEDPRVTLDFALSEQQELLRRVRQGLVEVATSRVQVERQTQSIEQRIPHLEDQARRALAAGRDDLARVALQRRQSAADELEDLRGQVASLGQEETKLVATEQALGVRIEEFRSRRNVMAARYTAAEAQVRVGEALTGVSGDLAELGMALGRAEEKTERMQARAAALDALLGSRSRDLAFGGGDDVERELRKTTAERDIDEQLAVLRQQLAVVDARPAPKEIS